MLDAPNPWEWAVLMGALVGGVAGRGAEQRLRSTGAGVWGFRAWIVAVSNGGWRTDAALMCIVFLTTMPAVFALWHQLSPYGSPMGADADGNFLAAVALARGLPSLYPGDRYPGFAALVAAVAPSTGQLAPWGMWVSEAAVIATVVGVYALARHWHGRAAGFVASLLYLRLPGVVDLGRQFTPYMVIAAVDALALLALSLWISGRRCGLLLALACAALFVLDPKQMAVALGLLALGIAVGVWRRHVGGIVACVLAIPLANGWAGTLHIPVFSVDHIAARVDLGVSRPPEPEMGGFVLGQSLADLPGSLLRLAQQSPDRPRSGLDPRARPALEMEFPKTTGIWIVFAVAGVCTAVFRSMRHVVGRPRALVAIAGVAQFVPSIAFALGILHLHFQHRYFVAVATLLLPAVTVGVGAVGGWGAIAGAGLVALFLPASPWHALAPNVLAPPLGDGEPWAGVEPADATQSIATAQREIPLGSDVFDYSSSRPWTSFAAVFRYHRCASADANCGRLITETPEAPIAIFVADEGLSLSVPDARTALRPLSAVDPSRVCWKYLFSRPGQGAAYRWVCDGRPDGAVHQQAGPAGSAPG